MGIRFEMPWNIWCTSCDSHIGRGVRYNAKKVHVGHYFSTKIWEFVMKCHLCRGIIKIRTDPKDCDYVITEGGKRRCMTYSTEDMELINIQSDAHKERMEMDPIYRLQHEEQDKKNKLQNALRLQSLHRLQQRDKNDYDNNCKLRKVFRAKKKRKLKLQKHASDKGLGIELLEMTKEDVIKAKAVKFGQSNVSAKRKRKRKRLELESESIFESLRPSVKKRKRRKLNTSKKTLNDKKRTKEETKLLLLNKMKNAKRKSNINAFSVDFKKAKLVKKKKR